MPCCNRRRKIPGPIQELWSGPSRLHSGVCGSITCGQRCLHHKQKIVSLWLLARQEPEWKGNRLDIHRTTFIICPMMRNSCLMAVLLVLWQGEEIRAQVPTSEEQQYLFSVLPLIEKGQLAQAEEQLRAGIKLYPRSAILHNAQGIVYQRQNKLDKAIGAFQEALALLPTFTAAQLHLAELSASGVEKRSYQVVCHCGSEPTQFEALGHSGTSDLRSVKSMDGQFRSWRRPKPLEAAAQASVVQHLRWPATRCASSKPLGSPQIHVVCGSARASKSSPIPTGSGPTRTESRWE